MRSQTLISLAMIASLQCIFSQGATHTPPPPQYRVTIQNDIIMLNDARTGQLLGKTTFERWGVVSPTRDKLRHVALDVTAAVVAGNGGREHTVDPNTPVYTAAEKDKAPHVTATVEHGIAFIIVSDNESCEHYEALLSAGPVHPR